MTKLPKPTEGELLPDAVAGVTRVVSEDDGEMSNGGADGGNGGNGGEGGGEEA